MDGVPRVKTKYYLIRLRNSSGRPRWAYIKTKKNFSEAIKFAENKFNKTLLAIEPSPVTPKPGRQIYEL